MFQNEFRLSNEFIFSNELHCCPMCPCLKYILKVFCILGD